MKMIIKKTNFKRSQSQKPKPLYIIRIKKSSIKDFLTVQGGFLTTVEIIAVLQKVIGI